MMMMSMLLFSSSFHLALRASRCVVQPNLLTMGDQRDAAQLWGSGGGECAWCGDFSVVRLPSPPLPTPTVTPWSLALSSVMAENE